MKIDKRTIWVGTIIVVVLLGEVVINSIHQTAGTKVSLQSASSNPQDIVPGLYPDPIKNNASRTGFAIKGGMVENNTNPSTGKATSDHLELQLANTTKINMTDFEVYYTMTDTKTLNKEGYYKKLTGYTLKAGTTATIQFDNTIGTGHFSTNTKSLYYTSTNAIAFDVKVSTPGFKVKTIQLTKAAGGAETRD